MAGDVKGDDALGSLGPGTGFGPSLVALGAMVVATATPYLVGVLAPLLTDALALSPTMYGVLAAAAYAVAAVTSRAVGAWTDRADVRVGLVALMAASCLSWSGLAVADGFWWAVFAAAVGGVSLAASNPLTNRLIAQARPRNFGLAVGLKQAGVPLSALLIGMVMPTLAAAWGWRLALCALLPVPVCLAVWGHRCFAQSPAVRAARQVVQPGRTKGVRRLSSYAGLMGIGGGLLNAYLALYAVTMYGSSTTTAGLLVALTGGVGIGARILWAWLTQRVAPTSLLVALAVGATVSAGLLLAAPGMPVVLVFACVLAGLTSMSWLGVAMVAIFRLEPGGIGVSTGSVSRGFYIGLLVAPIAGGLLLQYTDSYQLVWAFQVACFAGASVLALRAWKATRK